jgi:hypothetical protein
MKFCIKWASMYMVIRNEVKVMLFRLSAPRIFDQDCRNQRCLVESNWKYSSHLRLKQTTAYFRNQQHQWVAEMKDTFHQNSSLFNLISWKLLIL